MRLVSTNILYGGFMIPVKIGNHVRNTSASVMKYACPKCEDGGDISQKYICEKCGPDNMYTSGELRRKVDIGDEIKVFDKEQVKAINGESIIEILGVVPNSKIDIRKITGSYCVYPETPKKKSAKSKTAKPWTVLNRALAETEKAMVVRFTNNGKERLAYLVNMNGSLELICTAFEDDFQEPEVELPEVEITEQDIKSGVSLISKLQEPNLDEIVDERQARLEELITNGEPVESTDEEQKDEMAFFAQ